MRFERTALVFDETKQIRHGVIFWGHVINDCMGLSDKGNLYLKWDYAVYLVII